MTMSEKPQKAPFLKWLRLARQVEAYATLSGNAFQWATLCLGMKMSYTAKCNGQAYICFLASRRAVFATCVRKSRQRHEIIISIICQARPSSMWRQLSNMKVACRVASCAGSKHYDRPLKYHQPGGKNFYNIAIYKGVGDVSVPGREVPTEKPCRLSNFAGGCAACDNKGASVVRTAGNEATLRLNNRLWRYPSSIV